MPAPSPLRGPRRMDVAAARAESALRRACGLSILMPGLDAVIPTNGAGAELVAAIAGRLSGTSTKLMIRIEIEMARRPSNDSPPVFPSAFPASVSCRADDETFGSRFMLTSRPRLGHRLTGMAKLSTFWVMRGKCRPAREYSALEPLGDVG